MDRFKSWSCVKHRAQSIAAELYVVQGFLQEKKHTLDRTTSTYENKECAHAYVCVRVFWG